MRIGTRWPVGETPPAALPGVVVDAVRDEEATLAQLGADTTGWGWTLTYLEGAPVVELDDGTRISLEDGEVSITRA